MAKIKVSRRISQFWFIVFSFTGSYSYAQPLNGNYTVGAISSDYITVSDAVSALTIFGINGPVVFNIEPGNYTVHSIIPIVTGSSATNTITFQSSLQDSSTVELSYYATGDANNYIFRLDACSFVNFRHLTFHPLAPSYRSAIKILSNTHHIEIANNYFFAPPAGSGLINHSLIQTYGIGNNFNIHHNRFKDSGAHIWVQGFSFNLGYNLNINDNLFEGESLRGVMLSYQTDFSYSRNIATGERQTSTLEVEHAHGNIIMEQNKFDITPPTYLGKILDFSDMGGTITTPVLFANNFLIGSANVQMFNFSSCTYLNFFNNSLNSYGGGPGYLSFLSSFTGTGNVGVKLYNNIFQSDYDGFFAFSDLINPANIQSDYNSFFSNQPEHFLPQTGVTMSLTEWQAFTGLDQNSVFIESNFLSDHDLHIDNTVTINQAGTSTTGILIDIDNEIRNLPPDIGADEFDMNYSTYRDIAYILTSEPDTTLCAHADSVTLLVANYSTFPITSFEIKWWLFGLFKGSVIETTVIPPGDTIAVTFGNFDFNSNTMYDFYFEVDQPNGDFDHFWSNNTGSISYYELTSSLIHKKINPACSNDTELYIKDFPRESVLWSTGDTGNSIIISTPGTYSVQVTDENGCIVSDTFILN